jgi:WD40 repeat protein
VEIDREKVARALPKRYELNNRIGDGGFGAVFRVLDRELGRDIAVKASHIRDTDEDSAYVRPGTPTPAQARGQLAREEALHLARLDHPHIVRVLDTLQAEGLFLVFMELVRGQPLTKLRRPVTAEKVCALGLAVADALHFAHERQILHRDVKPANLMVTDDGDVKVVDFGIAKVMADAAIIGGTGTPAWMAPEQRNFQPLDRGTDLYSLALVLTWLLGGVIPRLPDSPFPAVDGRIEKVLRRALADSLAARQPTARDFALELADAAAEALGSGWLRRAGVRITIDRDVSEAAEDTGPARPPALRRGADLPPDGLAQTDLRTADLSGKDLSGAYLAGRDLSGLRLVGTKLAGADLRDANLSGTVLDEVTLAYADLRRADLSNARLIRADLTGAALRGGRFTRAALLSCALESTARDRPELADAAIPGRDSADLVVPAAWGGSAWDDAPATAVSLDGVMVAQACEGVVHLWNSATGREIRQLSAPGTRAVALSPDGRYLAASWRIDDAPGEVALWHLGSARPLRRLGITADHLRFTQDNRLLLYTHTMLTAPASAEAPAAPEELALNERLATADELLALRSANPAGLATPARVEVSWRICLADAGDGTRLADWTDSAPRSAAFTDSLVAYPLAGRVRVRDFRTGAVLPVFTHGSSYDVRSVSFSASGRFLAAYDANTGVLVWDLATKQQTAISGSRDHAERRPGRWAPEIVVSDDGSLVAAAWSAGVCVWEVARPESRPRVLATPPRAYGLRFFPDGRLLVSGAGRRDGAHLQEVWDTQGHLVHSVGRRPRTADAGKLSLSADGETLATVTPSGAVRVWDLAVTGTPVAATTAVGHRPEVVALSPDARLVASAGIDDSGMRRPGSPAIHLWEVDPLHQTHRLRVEEKVDRKGREQDLGSQTAWRRLEFSPDGDCLAVTLDRDTEEVTQVWHTGNGDKIAEEAFPLVPCSSDYDSLIGFQESQIVKISREFAVLPAKGPLSSVMRRTSVVSIDVGNVDVAFTPDGRRLLTYAPRNNRRVERDGTIRLWDTADGREIGRLAGPDDRWDAKFFSADGGGFAAVDLQAGQLHVWALEDGRLVGRFALPPQARMVALAWVKCAAALPGGTVMLSDLRTGSRLSLPGHTGPVRVMAFSKDCGVLLTSGDDGAVRLWDADSGASLGTLFDLDGDRWAMLGPDGYSYKLGPAGADDAFWWVVNGVRFDPGELDGHVPEIRRLRDFQRHPRAQRSTLRGQA